MQVSYFAKYDTLVEESSRDPKLAMRDCDRRLKKSPQDPAFNLFKVYLLIRQRAYEQAHLQCLELAQLPRAGDDVALVAELLRLYRKALQALGRDHEDVGLIKGLEKHKDCLQKSLSALIAQGYWEAAESAAISLQKTHPKDRQRQHVRFLMSDLYARACRASNPVVSSMRGRLLKAMLNKAVDGSALSTTQDLRFFLQLYVELEDWAAAVRLLDSDALGLFSPLGKADIEFIRVKLECLARLQKWEDIQGFCVHVIGAGGDLPVPELRQWSLDAMVWRHLADALVELKQSEPEFDFGKYASDLMPELDLDSSSSRVVWVSHMRFVLGAARRRGGANYADLVKVCTEFLGEHHVKRYCYEDLQPYLQSIPAADLTTLLEEAAVHAQSSRSSDAQGAIAELNQLKLRFFISLSKQRTPPLEASIDYVQSVLRYIEMLKSKSIADESILEEAFLLTVSGIEKASSAGKSEPHRSRLLVLATVLLEHALLSDNAPTSYRARLLLINYYRRLGCVSLAMQHYQALRIREIQNDTISHLLYHRISQLHPFVTDTVEQKRHKLDMPNSNPTLGLQKVIDWYDVAIDRTNGFLSGPIDDIRYDKVQEFLSLKERLERSLWRQLATLERRRIARLTDRAYDETDLKLDFLSTTGTNVSDMRDFSRGTVFRANDDPNWSPRDAADTSSAVCYAATLSELDATQSLLTVKDAGAEYKNSLLRLARDSEILKAEAPVPSPFSEGEQSSHELIRKIRPIALAAALGDKPEHSKSITLPGEKEIEAALLDASDFIAGLEPVSPDAATKVWRLPDDETMGTLICRLDCLKTIARLADVLATASKQKSHVLAKKVKADILTRLKKDAMTKGDVLQNAVQDWRRAIKSDWKTLLDPTASQTNGDDVWSDVAANIAGMVGRERMVGTMAPLLRDSMIETLDGILKIQIG